MSRLAIVVAMGWMLGCGGESAGPTDPGAGDPGVGDSGTEVVCTPQCDGKACGADGCGGSCGTCGDGETCAPNGTCGAGDGPCADHCTTLMAACTGADAPYPSLSACVEWCDASPWTLGTAGETGFPTLACHDEWARQAAGGDKTACAAAGPLSTRCGGECGGYCEAALALCGGDEPLYFDFESCLAFCADIPPGASLTGNTVACRLKHFTAAVLGTESAADACAAAPVDATVCVSVPPPNDTCATAVAVTAFPYDGAGDTSAAAPDYETGAGCCLGALADPDDVADCNVHGGSEGGAGGDVVYALTATSAGEYAVTIAGDYPRPMVLYAAKDCAEVNATCLGGTGDLWSKDGHALRLLLDAGETAYLVVDGLYAEDAGPFTIHVSAPCTPQCDGKECGNNGCGGSCGACAFGVECSPAGTCGAVPPAACTPVGTLACDASVTVRSDGEGATNVIGAYGCPQPEGELEPSYGGAPEIAWELDVAPGTRVVAYQVDPTVLDLMVLEDQGNGCYAEPGSCLVSGHQAAVFDVEAGADYYLVLDGRGGQAAETTVELSCCTLECGGKECGDDGCGYVCGFCADGEACSDAGECVCAPNCFGKQCGDDGCGGSCGTCPDGGTCDGSGHCPVKSCAGTCGEFIEGDACQCDAYCVVTGDCCPDACEVCAGELAAACGFCAPQCDGKACGDDGCGGQCGSCAEDEACNPNGQCQPVAPSCDGQCGGESADGSCHCDELCFTYGDCCTDVCDHCAPDLPAQCAGCFPSCFGRSCGDDGCGGSCGTCTGDASCVEGLCFASGDTCQTAEPVALGGTVTGDLASASADHAHFSGGMCFGAPAEGRERVYAFTPTTSDWVRLTLDVPPQSVDMMLWVGWACEGIDGACLAEASAGIAGTGETLDLYLEAGATVYVVVDELELPESTSTMATTYSLTVTPGTPPCFPQCQNKACGDDGCGGFCGYCDAGDSCVAGTCVCVPSCEGKVCGGDGCGGDCGSPCGSGGVCSADQKACSAPGDTCGAPFAIEALPFTGTGDTAVLANDQEPDGCGGAQGGYRDAVYRFTPPERGEYSFSFGDAGEPGHPYSLVVTTGCPAAECVGGSGDLYGGGTLDVILDPAETYYVTVDGFQTDGLPDEGPYSLHVALKRPLCATGEPIGCGETRDVVVGNATGISSWGCPGGADGLGAGEAILTFAAEATGEVAFVAEGVPPDFRLLVLDAGPTAVCDPAGCAVAASAVDGTIAVAGEVAAGSTYHVVVDAPAEQQALARVTVLCDGLTTGDHCALPGKVGSLPFEQVLDPTTMADDTVAGVCLGASWGEGLPDAVLLFVPSETSTYAITLPGFVPGTGSSLVAVTTSCEAPSQLTCAGGKDFYFDPQGALTVPLEAGVPYYVVLDSYSPDEIGPSVVHIEESCTPDCVGRICGPDGCGGTCGTCVPGTQCDDSAGMCY